MAKHVKDKKRLAQVENDISKWKEQGYKIPEIERLVKFVKEHRTPSVKRILIHIGVISFLVTVIIILATIPYAILAGDNYVAEVRNDCTYNAGTPLPWISIIYDYSSSKVDIDNIIISSESNLVIDCIFFLFVLFISMSLIYLFVDKIITRMKLKKEKNE